MPIPDPWSEPKAPAEPAPGAGPTRAPAPEQAHAPAREEAPEPSEQDEVAGEVLPFPGTETVVATDRDKPERPNRVKAAVVAWAGEARESATAAVDGSVWRARPPALRDIYARLERAEWAGDIPALRVVGQGFGYLSLAITAVGYGLLWIARRPSRLLLTVLITVLVVVLAI